jgi:hypothetical protein
MIRDEVEGIRVGDPSGVNSSGFPVSVKGSVGNPTNAPFAEDFKDEPIVHWLNISGGDTPPNPWINLTWGTDTLDDFAQALVTSGYFDSNDIVDPSAGDTVCGKDSAGTIVVLKVTLPVANGVGREQKPAPAGFK